MRSNGILSLYEIEQSVVKRGLVMYPCNVWLLGNLFYIEISLISKMSSPAERNVSMSGNTLFSYNPKQCFSFSEHSALREKTT